MAAKILVSNIIWDVDDEAEKDDLPDSVIIENPTQDMLDNLSGYSDQIADYLSDQYGFCVQAFLTEKQEDPPENLVLFEIRFNHPGDPEEAEVAMCGRGVRVPTVEEANVFYALDVVGYAEDRPVVDVWEISRADAEAFFDMSNENNWPIFGV